MKLSNYFITLAALSILCSCGQGRVQKTSDNPHACVTDRQKVQIISSLKEISPDCLYEMDYTIDYKLDELIDANVCDVESFGKFFATHMLDVIPSETPSSDYSSGCSAYAAKDIATGNFLMGRNYDYCHVENGEEVPITAIFVRTAPKGGKKSISMIDSYWLGYHKGFYKDGVSDLSMLLAAPYEMLDGVNEDGFAICVLHLDGKATYQDDPGKKSLWTNILMRKLLDNAGTVEEALNMVKDYNVKMKTPASGNFHFFLADATGDYAILEYSYPDAASTDTELPNVMKVLRGEEKDRYVTNFYVDPDLAEHPKFGPLGKHGLWRYDTLRVRIENRDAKFTISEAMDALKAVSQDSHPGENTSHTQWSALYNLTQKKVDVAILQDYENQYSFEL